jgi:hypothetical protein
VFGSTGWKFIVTESFAQPIQLCYKALELTKDKPFNLITKHEPILQTANRYSMDIGHIAIINWVLSGS